MLPERCISLFVEQAQTLGATVHTNERTLEWHPTLNGVSVRTERGEYEAETLVISAGAWASKLLPALSAAAIPERQVLAWFEILRPEHFTPDVFPVFNLVVDEGQFYGFPEFGIPGFKLGSTTISRRMLTQTRLTVSQTPKMNQCCAISRKNISRAPPARRLQ